MPLTFVNAVTSFSMTARPTSGTLMVDRMASATFGPTPEIPRNNENNAFSSSRRNPKIWNVSSRMWQYVSNVAVWSVTNRRYTGSGTET